MNVDSSSREDSCQEHRFSAATEPRAEQAQLLLKFSDEAESWPLEPHVDEVPPWAMTRRYRGIIGVLGAVILFSCTRRDTPRGYGWRSGAGAVMTARLRLWWRR